MKNIKIDVFKILFGFSFLSFVIICLALFDHNKTLDIDLEGMMYMENISSGVQRVSKLELENSPDDVLISEIDKIASDLYSDESIGSFEENEEILALAKDVVEDWNSFRNSVMNFRETGNRDELFLASESNYNNVTNIIKKVNTYIGSYAHETDVLKASLIGSIVAIALLLCRILINTHKELTRNKELSKDMYIDLATGIYNRSKCQEVMKSPITPDNSKERAVVIFDLNDLKKTNDSLGHRAGDQLISSFAEQVKNATKIFPYETFVGRYGGDEFMAYFDFVEKRDVELYIEEVEFLMNKFNTTQNKSYKLSCAAGYGITTESTKSLTVKELFDIADADMYKNKIAMKEKKRQELRKQGIEESEVIDDRL